jgi:ribosomal-protein-alanine N-acetyltransferase
MVELETKRLKLREWRDADFVAFQKLTSDPVVMEYFPSLLTPKESNALAKRFQNLIASRGWGFWAVEEKSSGKFIGYVGLHKPASPLPFKPCVEIGWRLLKEYWGKGYATEAGTEALRFAFEELKLDEVVSFTAVINTRSEAVMKRLGMRNSHKNFKHPSVPMAHRLREHLLYRLTKEGFEIISEQKKR